jgi:hypothetical protein
MAKTPAVDASAWRLTIDGLVENPATFTMEDLKALPAVEEMRTLECISNPVGGALIGNLIWKGVYLPSLMEALGVKVKPEAVRARFDAADGYFTTHTLDWVLQPATMLVYEMNGAPLTPDHGYPLRVFMPGLYGQKNPKWLTRIEFIDEHRRGYWELQGWSDVADVQTNAIIRQPLTGARLVDESVPIFGVAFAGQRRITSVEVQIDEEEWRPAGLVQADSSLVWTQWSVDWMALDGQHSIAVRATDETGFTQTDRSSGIFGETFPHGTSKIHSVLVAVMTG